MEETRVAILGIIVENHASVERLNALLHDYSDFIIGRMGIPYRERNLSVISIAIDAPLNVINGLCGKIGKLEGINVKAAYSNIAGKT